MVVSRSCGVLPGTFEASIFRLPTELLSFIFQQLLEESERDFLNQRQYPTHIPLLLLNLARVCRLWKCVVESTPRLWRNVQHTVYRAPFYPYQTTVERSGVVLLNVYSCGTNAMLELVEYLSTLGATRRVRILELAEGRRMSQAIMPHLLSCAWPKLECLVLRGFEDVGLVELVAFLQENGLCSLLLEDVQFSTGGFIDSPRLLPHLQKLEFTRMGMHNIRLLLSSILPPRLELLFFGREYMSLPDFDHEWLFGHPVAAFESVRELTIGGICPTPAELANILHYMSNVEVLGIFEVWKTPHNSNDLLDALEGSERDSLLVPRLHTLSLYECSVTITCIHRLIDTRRAPASVPMKAIGLGPKAITALEPSERQMLVEKVEVFEWLPKYYCEGLTDTQPLY